MLCVTYKQGIKKAEVAVSGKVKRSRTATENWGNVNFRSSLPSGQRGQCHVTDFKWHVKPSSGKHSKHHTRHCCIIFLASFAWGMLACYPKSNTWDDFIALFNKQRRSKDLFLCGPIYSVNRAHVSRIIIFIMPNVHLKHVDGLTSLFCMGNAGRLSKSSQWGMLMLSFCSVSKGWVFVAALFVTLFTKVSGL